ncbi:hypothetical protein BFJ69_g13244 [Fusarium oxysporum]|uniref:Heterokaryon incompatibility domain-containing protein n=1 Tax=Fusarium oxysporum TaxID=5507 RepID=A0A420MLG0_FUSOX|nr:hypothetical protein BFJ69_g13244 [Fusarium oxysporum]
MKLDRPAINPQQHTSTLLSDILSADLRSAPLHDPRFQDIHHNTLGATKRTIEIGQGRRFVLERLSILENSLPPKPIRVVKELVQTVWAAYDVQDAGDTDPCRLSEEALCGGPFEKIYNSRDFEPILNLLKHPWFTRRWTLQEGFLARHAIVCCGSNKISWHWFTEGLKLINHRARDFQDLQSNTDALYALQVLETLRDPADILSLLWKLHQNQCSDPRDRIYSLIGLAKSLERISPYSKFIEEVLGEPRDLTSSRQKIPVPDYALEAQVVFRELAGQCILADQFLRILFHLDAFGSLSKANSKWPSWVPDWAGAKDCRTNSREEMSSILPTSQCIDDDLYCRMEIPRYEIGYGPILDEFIYPRPTEFSEESYHGLIIYGEFHERILEVCEPWPKSDETDDLIAYLFHWIHEKSILHSDDQSTMGLKHKVVHSLLLLITGAHFFGYEDHPFLRDAEDMVVYTAWARRSVRDTDPKRRMNDLYRMANLVYPILEDPWFFLEILGNETSTNEEAY